MAHARVEWALPSLCDWSFVTKRGTRASLPLLEGCIDSATEVDTLSAVDANRRLHNFALFIRPKPGQLVLSRYINSLIRFYKTRGRGRRYWHSLAASDLEKRVVAARKLQPASLGH